MLIDDRKPLDFDLLSHGLKVALHPVDVEMQSIRENDFECFASTGMNSPETMRPN